MNDNYLWDRTGEADAEVQRLEELLGTLRYQPKPLPIPASMKIGGKRDYYAPLAIAAALALLVLAAGIWIRLRTAQSTAPVEAARDTRIDSVLPPTAPPIAPEAVAVTKQPSSPNTVRQPQRIAGTIIHKPRVRREEPQLTTQELAQKEQLLTALRLVSAKLNLAQRKSQGLPQPNIIRNQHRIG
ncbi:MAG TPA: hypothetical protein VNG71_02505 [Pyrinomonadaceae bacterium]|nr:hypothetical protein [Pyrinomonadaceae bacterium]